MRLLAATVAALALAAGAFASPHATALQPTKGSAVFVITGGGWGHGVGLSQWGAFGQAQAGRTYREILGWYYRGTELGTTPVSRVRVLLSEDAGALEISSPVPFRVRADGATYEVPAGAVRLTPDLKLRVDGKLRTLPGPLAFQPGKGASLTLGGVSYRGELVVSKEAKRLRAINVIGLESYLPGVVAREMPKDWPLEALKAQAVAARTYTLTRFAKDKPYDLTADVLSQVYGGASGEAARATQAVRATAGEVVLHQGAPAITFYFSSSGGRTANIQDVFSAPLPYLVSVDDPWDRASPNHVWKPQLLTGAGLAGAFGLSSPVADAMAQTTSSGRAKAVTLTTASGETVTATGTDIRTRLNLRSQYFRLGVLRLDRSTVTGTGRVRLTGLARAVESPVLEKLGPKGWRRAVSLSVRPDGSFDADVRPMAPTRYRLAAAGFAGPAVVVRATTGGGS